MKITKFDIMKYLFPLLLLLISCQKEKTECFCRRQVWKIGVFNSPGDPFHGKQTLQFMHYDPYYREDCYKGGKWYEMDSTKKYYLICDL